MRRQTRSEAGTNRRAFKHCGDDGESARFRETRQVGRESAGDQVSQKIDHEGHEEYEGKTMWKIRLFDKNDPLTSLYIYVDAINGEIIGAGASSD